MVRRRCPPVVKILVSVFTENVELDTDEYRNQRACCREAFCGWSGVSEKRNQEPITETNEKNVENNRGDWEMPPENWGKHCPELCSQRRTVLDYERKKLLQAGRYHRRDCDLNKFVLVHESASVA